MIEDRELYIIKGGSFSFSANFFNYISKYIYAAMDAGRNFGTSIRMIVSGMKC